LALELDRSSAHAYNLLGLIARARGDLDTAARYFKKAIALDELPEVLNNYGEIFVERREWHDALDLFAQALEIDPTYVDARANLAKALYYTQQKETAAKEYLKCTEQNPEHCECRLGLGVIAAESGDSGGAIDHFDKLTQICPSGTSFYNLCWAYLGVRRCSEAVDACARAIAVHPGYIEAQEAQTRAVECVAEQEGALREYRARVEARPDDPELHFNLGRIYEEHNRYPEARACFDRCLHLDPGHVLARYHAARVADRLLLADDTVSLCESFLERARAGFEEEKAWCVQRVRELR
jgi:tetratricopeptide (TPR) repeat protein